MSGGYTPVFGSLFKGSLCGQWPALPVFMSILPLADSKGEIDCTYEYISMVTGWPMDLLRQGIRDLESPDPASRSDNDDGRRLARLRNHTDWGWRVVNHGMYREKARLAAKNAREVESGKNAARMSDRRGPPETADDRLSNTNTNTDKKEESATSRGGSDIQRIFDHWRSEWKHSKAQLDDKRKKLIKAALKLYTADQLCLAISGYLKSSYHTGKNERGTVYSDIELFLRDAKHIDAGLKFAEHTEPQKWQ